MDELEKMDLKELRDLRARVERAIEGFKDRKRREALAAAEEAVRTHGFSLAELTGAKPGRKNGTKNAPRYANPSNREQTWTGRGRRPRWIADHVKQGGDLKDLEI